MRELIFSITLKDCEVQTFRCGGPGGQKQNKTSSGVRVIHRDSGARGESREHRSQLQNKKVAFRRMAETPEFKRWVHYKAKGSPEERVARDMQPENLIIYGYEDGKVRLLSL